MKERKCEPFSLKTKAECINCGHKWYLMEKPPVCHAIPSQVKKFCMIDCEKCGEKYTQGGDFKHTCHAEPPQPDSWEVEFDEKAEEATWNDGFNDESGVDYERIKSFIRSTIQSAVEREREEMVREVEGMLKNKKLPNNISKEYKEMSERYDLWREIILSDVLEVLKSKGDKK